MIYSIPVPSPFAVRDVSKGNVSGQTIAPARLVGKALIAILALEPPVANMDPVKQLLNATVIAVGLEQTVNLVSLPSKPGLAKLPQLDFAMTFMPPLFKNV